MDANYKLCYVAFLDILGFKDIVNKWDCEQIAGIFEDIQNKHCIGISFGDQPAIIPEQLKYYIMSDSIIIHIDVECQYAFHILLCCISLMQEILCNRENPVFLRGAVVKGNIYHDGNVIFGPAVTNAYLISEKNAKYPRVIMTKELYNTDGNSYVVNPSAVYEDYDEWICVENSVFNFPERLKYDFLKFCQECIDTILDDNIREKYIYLKRHFLDTTNKNKSQETTP